MLNPQHFAHLHVRTVDGEGKAIDTVFILDHVDIEYIKQHAPVYELGQHMPVARVPQSVLTEFKGRGYMLHTGPADPKDTFKLRCVECHCDVLTEWKKHEKLPPDEDEFLHLDKIDIE